MISCSKKHYQTYKFDTRNEFFSKLNELPQNKDRIYMMKMLKLIIDYLEKVNVIYYQDFIKIFKNYGLKTNYIHDFIMKFKEYITSKNGNSNEMSFQWLHKRELYKSNNKEKNLILNRLSHEYSNEILCFTQEYFQTIFPNNPIVNNIMNEMHEKIENLLLSSKNMVIESKSVKECPILNNIK